MLPMITCMEEIEKTKDILKKVEQKLTYENKEYCNDYSLGIMVETPASAVMAESFAKACGFLSIGTNDLVQYIMAADRGNAYIENLYNPYNPAVIKTIYNVINAANKTGIDVSVCGDLAANTDFTELLVGMGLRRFSVPLPMLGRIKDKISQISVNEAKNLCQEVLNAENDKHIAAILKRR